jgi:methionyl-tRNA synthetase
LFGELQGKAGPIAELYDAREYGKVLREVMALTDKANLFVDQNKPWEIAKQAGSEQLLQQVCSDALNMFRLLTIYLKPVLPALAANVEKFLGTQPLSWADARTLLPEGHRINDYKHLMIRVDQKQIAALVEANRESLQPAPQSHSPQRHAQHQEKAVEKNTVTTPPPAGGGEGAKSAMINIDEFTKVDLRVARIVSAEHVEGAEKLLKLQLDIGTETRQVFAGIKSAYDPAKLVGRLTVMVANLQPRKMRFGESQGMVLAASGEGPGIFLLSPDDGAQPGMKVK